MLRSTSVSWWRGWGEGGVVHRACVLVFMSGAIDFAATSQGRPLDGQALVAGEACISGCYGIIAIRKWLLAGCYPRTLQRQQIKGTPPVFL